MFSKSDLVRAAGYAAPRRMARTADFHGPAPLLRRLKARVSLGVGGGKAQSQGVRSLSYTQIQFTANLLVAKAYTACLTSKPVNEF